MGLIAKQKNKATFVLLLAAIFEVIETAIRFERYLDKGRGYASLTAVGAIAAAFSIFFVYRRLKNDVHAPFEWRKILRSWPIWRLHLYLAFVIFIFGLFTGVSRTKYMFQAFVWIAIAGHLAALSKPHYSAKLAQLAKKLRVPDMILFNLSMAVILAEIVLRAVASVYPSPLLIHPHRTGNKMIQTRRFKPHFNHLGFNCNSLGYFDTEFTAEKPPGTHRIIALADSFGIGVVPYEKNYLTLIEKKLNSCNPERPTEVYNMSIAGIGPENYRILLEQKGMLYNPDEVIVSLFVGNDFFGAPPNTIKRKFRKVYPNDFILVLTTRRMIAIYSQMEQKGEDGGNPRQDSAPKPFPEKIFLEIENERLTIVRDAALPKFHKRYEWVFKNILQMNELMGGRLTVTIIPDEFQVNPELLAKLGKPGETLPPIDMPQKRIMEFCEKESIRCLDLLPALSRAQAEEGPTYKIRDTHWNELGNEIAAEVIVEAISGGKCTSRRAE